MSLITRTYNFTNGTTADGTQVDTNENTVYTWANGNVDHFNIGSAGIYPSQLVPTSAAQATLAGSIGLILGGYAQTVVPLTLYANASQTADIQQWLLTNGGTKTAWVDKLGQFNLTAGAATSLPLTINGASSQSALYFLIQDNNGHSFVAANPAGGPSGTNFSLDIGNTTTGNGGLRLRTSSIGGTTTFQANSGSPSGTAVAGTVTGIHNGATLLQSLDATGNVGIAGTLTQGSLRAIKRDIRPLSMDPLELIEQVDWIEFNGKDEPEDARRHIGYVADDTHEFLSGKDHQEGYEPGSIAGLGCAGVKALLLRVRALEAKVAGAPRAA